MNIQTRILKLFSGLRQDRAKAAGPERTEIVLSGSGGQGIGLAGMILAEAAAIYDKKEAVMSQSYGPEARGGASRAEIVIGSPPIHYPKVISADALLAMTEESLYKYKGLLKPGGLLIVDETFIKKIPEGFKNVLKAPFASLSVTVLEAHIVANIMALGFLVAVTNVVSRDALLRALLSRIPEKALALDRIALDMGFKLAEDKLGRKQ